MKFNELPENAVESIVHQIEAMINAFSNQGRLGTTPLPEGLSLYESCREEIFDLPEQWQEILHSQKSESIEQWRRPGRPTWYHQLRTNNEEFGFARSIELDSSEGGGHRVIEVVPSHVAKEFQKTVRLLDTHEPEAPPGNEPPAMLLHVPRYAFYGLAKVMDMDAEAATAKKALGSISRVYPFFSEQLEAFDWKLEPDSLVGLLRTLPSAFGALGAAGATLKTTLEKEYTLPTIAELLLAELEREAVGTRRVLERVPEGRNDWKPHEKSMSLGYLAGLVATIPSWAAAMITQDQLDLSAPGEIQTQSFATNHEILEAFEKALNQAREALAATTDEHLMTSWRLLFQGHVVSEQPRYVAIRDGAFNHMAHHRGQLTVYLRLNDVPVPSLYGPSADEGGFK